MWFRVTISLPPELSRQLLGPKTEEKILGLFPAHFRIAHVNLLINPAHNRSWQNWHQDNSDVDADAYYTLLVPLVDAPGMGKTEVVVPYAYDFPEGQCATLTPNVTVGDGLCFSGCLWHRGTPNLSSSPRHCLYMIVTSADQSQLSEDWK